MTNYLQIIKKPEYFFRPGQVLTRLKNSFSTDPGLARTLPLSWGIPIKAFTRDQIGQAIAKMGIYDIPVLEMVFRLVDPGETCIDVGANVGLVSLAMAINCGEEGSVFSFEPEPDVLKLLQENVQFWSENFASLAKINVGGFAVSSSDSIANLNLPPNFSARAGHASLSTTFAGGQSIQVKQKTLDSLFQSPIGLLKADVEGHELSVLHGAKELLAKHLIRDIIYEDHDGYPSSVSRFLELMGYKVFSLKKGFWNPEVKTVASHFHHDQTETPNYIATVDESRLWSKLEKRGWKTLQFRI